MLRLRCDIQARTAAVQTMKHPSENQSQEVLAGLVERVTYHNVENGFCVPRRGLTPLSAGANRPIKTR
jgi:hypothetical protein